MESSSVSWVGSLEICQLNSLIYRLGKGSTQLAVASLLPLVQGFLTASSLNFTEWNEMLTHGTFFCWIQKAKALGICSLNSDPDSP